ncbi:glutathione S-transferase U21 isoform X2 [Cryptomeria japonica]|uniref:glutathione S-transferase U21 isoform X2 n=1 Tax=Cryptomeria japonica TaxID=3369 RepID=UPI0027DAAA71|nr:glutathione S-transferase U21 isoform X2 [Cryptomeria japonica]
MAGEDEVKLLGFWASPFALRVMIALEEKGIKYEYIEEDLLSKKSPLLQEMNPVHKQIPVLIHNGRPVAESAIILQYIDEVWSNGPAFLPSDPYDQAMALFWVDFIEKKLILPGRLIFGTKKEEQEGGKRQVIESLGIREETLKGKEYFGGKTFGMVDIAFAPVMCFFHTYEVLGNFKIMFEDKFPSIFCWMKKCRERESIKKLLPQQEKVLQLVMQFTKRA